MYTACASNVAPWMGASEIQRPAEIVKQNGSHERFSFTEPFTPTLENATAKVDDYCAKLASRTSVALVLTTQTRNVWGEDKGHIDSEIKIVLITGAVPDSANFVFPISQQPIYRDLTQTPPGPGHYLLGIVREDKVSIWDPNSDSSYWNGLAEPLCAALNKARPGRNFQFGNMDHAIYKFDPQSRLTFVPNKFCQSFVILKMRDLVENGFPGEMETYDYSDAAAFAEEHFAFSAPPPEVRDHFKEHDYYAGMFMASWMPKEIESIADLPNKKFEVMRQNPAGENVVAVGGAAKLLYEFNPDEIARRFAPDKLRTVDQMIALLSKGQNWPLTDGTFELEEKVIGIFRGVGLGGRHVLHLGPVAKQYGEPYNKHTRREWSERIHMHVNDRDEVCIFRDTYYPIEGYYSPHKETEVQATVPGLYKKIQAAKTFLGELEHNKEFRGVIAEFDLKGSDWGFESTFVDVSGP